ncbi:MAG: SUMF1/EgtB/PvdO family nonheme iron enzyme [Planctomycetota bacterium]
MMFGAAFGRLPGSKTQLSKEQNRFLDQAVRSIASGGRVVSVHLSLLAQILKERDWDASSELFRDGGVGIGVRFLEETFGSQNASPRVQHLADPCENVLRALLPAAGSNIKGGIQSESELKAALGDQAGRFPDAIAFLDSELHLITPTEDGNSKSGEAGYQLTHDFLIAPIRQWVSLRNRTTKVGRARLRLEELSSLYRLRPIAQTLPTLGEYLSIRRNVPLSSLNPAESKMMGAARRLHRRRVVVTAVLLGLLAIVGWFTYSTIRKNIDDRHRQDELAKLLAAPLDQTFSMSAEARQDELLRQDALRTLEESTDEAERIRAAAINFDVEDRAASLLVEHALVSPVGETVAIARDAFPQLKPELQKIATDAWEKESTSPGQRVRAACLLSNDERLRRRFEEPEEIKRLIDLLLVESPVRSELWAEGFRDLVDELMPPLEKRLLDRRRDKSLLTAVNLILQFVPDDTELLVELIRIAKPDEFQLLVQKLSTTSDGIKLLRSRWDATRATKVGGDPAQPWGSPWWVIGDRRPLKGPFRELVLSPEEIDSFDAIVRQHAMLMHRVPETRLQPMIERARNAGYRIADASPYVDLNERYFFALWVHDGAPGIFEWDLSAETLRRRNKELRDTGWYPCNLDGYLQDGEMRYLCNWIRLGKSSSLVEADLYVEVNENEHKERGWGRMMERGMMVPRASVQVHLDAPEGDDDWISSVRWEPVSSVGESDGWELSVTEPSRGEPLVSLSRDPFLDTQVVEDSDLFSGIWWGNLDVESSEARFQIRSDHRRDVIEKLDKGFYPVSIAAAYLSDSDEPQFQSAWWRASVVDQKIKQSRELVRLVLALLYLGDDRYVCECLDGLHGSEVRGAVVTGLRDFAASPDWLVDQIVSENVDTLRRRTCLMALAKILPAAAPKQRERLTEFLPRYAAVETDPGVRSTIELLSDSWTLGYELPAPLSDDDEFLSSAGDRMIVIRPSETVWIGSTEGEPGRSKDKEDRKQIRLGGAYAISAREVTIEQLLRLLPNHEYPGEYASTTDRPAFNVTWYDAAKYCRLLSEAEGIPESEMCYPPVDEIGPGMQVPADAVQRKGYRLPTEAEWEHAARGGHAEGRWFGFDPERLRDHAWTNESSGNRAQPVGRLLPNDYGLFDMLGNIMEFCHGPKDRLSELEGSGPHDDPGAVAFQVFDEGPKLPARGGAMMYQPGDARASQRNWAVSTHTAPYSGFRIVRTVD